SFPPPPAVQRVVDTVLTKACKTMSKKNFEEAGCTVCGELKLLSNMARLKSIKRMLHVLEIPGVTRAECSSSSRTISEYKGPVLDYTCDRVCFDCQMAIKNGKVPRMALANDLWIGEVPAVLKDLRFVEKMLVARARHTCAYVKVASGMRKMKANVVAFEAPALKVYE
ncbi:hypothetical protein CPB84DRAFT_1642036, partial [Gymnopilus junonius]